MGARRPDRRAAVAAVTAALLLPGCGGVADRAADADPPTAEEFLDDVESYLAALQAGDLDAAWDLVCHDGFGASDQDEFEAHHQVTPRPVAWDLAYVTSGTGTGRSSSPGGAGGTPSGAAGTVELSDGSSGEVRLLYGDAGLCQILGDEPVARALDPSPTSR